jgi:hypothetical protein
MPEKTLPFVLAACNFSPLCQNEERKSEEIVHELRGKKRAT